MRQASQLVKSNGAIRICGANIAKKKTDWGVRQASQLVKSNGAIGICGTNRRETEGFEQAPPENPIEE